MTPCYITTPIYYVNDRPHIGHCYTALVADVYARFQRLARGEDQDPTRSVGVPKSVFLLTGTDEHADKVVTSAAAHGKTPQEWADINAEEFKKAFAFMGITNDDFIRTSERRHKDLVPTYIRKLMDSGDIYKGQYTGWYDEGQEEYLTETAARDADFKSAVSGKALVKRTEDCYFFRLSKYQDRLLAHLNANPRFVQPDSRRQEVLGRLRQGLNDVPVSRPVTADPATQWGIRIPGDDANRVYVWIDALFNYLTTVDTPERRRFWPPVVHVLGKDILWFHAVIWPCLLMALGEPLPGMIFGHGWWVSNGQKMSKSLGNFIDLEQLQAYAAKFSLDAVRWHLVTQGPLSGADADFNHPKLVETYNTDLANGIGNCASRVGNMVEKYFGGSLPARSAAAHEHSRAAENVVALANGAAGRVTAALDAFAVDEACATGIKLVRAVDEYISATAPFKLAKDPANLPLVGAILAECAEAVRIASVLLSPAMPAKMAELWKTWSCTPPAGATLADLCAFGGPHALAAGHRVAKGEILFLRADTKEAL